MANIQISSNLISPINLIGKQISQIKFNFTARKNIKVFTLAQNKKDDSTHSIDYVEISSGENKILSIPNLSPEYNQYLVKLSVFELDNTKNSEKLTFETETEDSLLLTTNDYIDLLDSEKENLYKKAIEDYCYKEGFSSLEKEKIYMNLRKISVYYYKNIKDKEKQKKIEQIEERSKKIINDIKETIDNENIS